MTTPRSYKCYMCGKGITPEEVMDVLHLQDVMPESIQLKYMDAFAHCIGDDENFTDDGAVVVCFVCHVVHYDTAVNRVAVQEQQVRISNTRT